MIGPWDLKNMIQKARLALDRDEIDTAFALAWILWEAFRFRILLIEAYRKGWAMKEARNALGKCRLSTNKDFSLNFRKITNKKVQDAMPLSHGKRWSTLIEIEKTRHRFFHGYSTPAGEHVKLETEFLLAFCESWENAIKTSRVTIANPFEPQKRKRSQQTESKLSNTLGCTKSMKVGPLPNKRSMENAIREFQRFVVPSQT